MDLTDSIVGITVTEMISRVPWASTQVPPAEGRHLSAVRQGARTRVHRRLAQLQWVGKPKPPGGVQRFEADRLPAFLIQWSWVITMTLHRETPDPDEWLRRDLDGLEEPLC